MSDLPADLVEEIFSRVLATSLKRLMSTCKRLNALFKDPIFSEKHFRNAPKQSHVLMLKEDRLFPMSVDLNVVPPSIEFKDALSLKDSHSDIDYVFHCDGLLLCITKDNKPVVWNPYLGQTRWIQHNKGYDTRCRFSLGYGNNQSCRSYKTLMYWERCLTNNPLGGFEIYEFDSHSWRVVIAPNCVSIGIQIGFSGVTLKGNTYWISVDTGDDFLLSFDFTRERFRRLCLPPSKNYMALSVVREEQLSVLSLENNLVIWVTKKTDSEEELSWSKSFAVDFYGPWRSDFTSFLFDDEKKVALCCNSVFSNTLNGVYTVGEEDKYHSKVFYMKTPYGESWRPFVFSYVPSLVQIQPKTVVSSSQAVPIVSQTATFFGDVLAATENNPGNPLPLPLGHGCISTHFR